MMQNVPRKNYRLHDGTLGTEYESILECILRLEAKQRHLEEELELLRIRLQTAEGAPP